MIDNSTVSFLRPHNNIHIRPMNTLRGKCLPFHNTKISGTNGKDFMCSLLAAFHVDSYPPASHIDHDSCHSFLSSDSKNKNEV